MEESLINWNVVLQVGWLTLLGLLVHLLDKIDSAKKIDGFTWREFWNRNLVGYVTSLILCFVGLAFIGNSIELVAGTSKMVIAFGLGYGGGSMVRSFMSKYMSNKK